MEVSFMISWFVLMLLIFLQGLTGLGVISLFRVRLKPGMLVALWMMTGIAVFSFVPFLLQLFFIPLTSVNIYVALILTSLLANSKYKLSIDALKQVFEEKSFRIRIYEIPFLFVIGAIVLISVWRCFYWPPTSRDITSGAEVIAAYTIKEKTMINSVFSVNLESTNNQFKPPFVTCLQVIYKYAGFSFGQLWLSMLFISFIVFLYHALGQTLHKMLAGLLVVMFLAIPEMYGYTFMILFDYSNAVFFFLSAYFLFKSNEKKDVMLAGVLMGIATYIRSETLLLACMMALIIAWQLVRRRNGWGDMFISLAWFLLPAAIFYLLSITIYINLYLPAAYHVGNLVNPELFSFNALAKRFIIVNKELIISKQAIEYYAYSFFIFGLVLLTDFFWPGKWAPAARQWLFAVLVIYLGLPLLGHILPLLDIDNSTKRGFFKIFPLMLLYMGNSNCLVSLSKKLAKWENTV